jgi:hypothetical protein
MLRLLGCSFLSLDRDIERTHGLVENKQLRLDGKGVRDANALPLRPGQFVRIPVEERRIEAVRAAAYRKWCS